MSGHIRAIALTLAALGIPVAVPDQVDAQYWRPYPLIESAASLRVDFQPEDAEVFVDGYYAGRVDEFDGIFQRLRLEPGGHEITVYHEGYRTIRQKLYLRPFGDQTFRGAMERLAPGEVAEPPAVPVDEPPQPAPAGPPERPRGAPERPEAEQAVPVPQGRLLLHLQPADAEVYVDDEPWNAGDQPRVAIELPAGRHTVEIRKAGFVTWREDVLILRNGTLRLSVTLKPGDR